MRILRDRAALIGLAAISLACGLVIVNGNRTVRANAPVLMDDEIGELQRRLDKLETERAAIQKTNQSQEVALDQARQTLAQAETRWKEELAKAEERSKIAVQQGLEHNAADTAVKFVNSPPPGSILGYIGNWPKDEKTRADWADVGYALADGSPFDKEKYPSLYRILGSDHLPDLQGEFLRGIDRGVETGHWPWEGLRLRLMPSINDVSMIPNEGERELLIIAAVKRDQTGNAPTKADSVIVHFRIFDRDGKIALDTDETRLKGESERIRDLKYLLRNLFIRVEREGNEGLDEIERQFVITHATFILDYGRRDPDGVRPPGSRQMHTTALPTERSLFAARAGGFDPAEGDYAHLLKLDGEATIHEDDSTSTEPNLKSAGRIRRIPEHGHHIVGGDPQTAPRNVSVYWLIKVK